MNNQFDELSKQLAQSVTRRAALKKAGVGLAGMALACFGLANTAKADPKSAICKTCIDNCTAINSGRGPDGFWQKFCRSQCSAYC